VCTCSSRNKSCEVSVYVVYVPVLFIKLIVIVMVLCYLHSFRLTQDWCRCKLPDDDMKMSKYVGVLIIHCCDMYFYDINCAFVGLNKK